MDKREVIDITKQFSKIIFGQFQATKVILFGSYAKGTQNIHRDIDLQ